MSTYQNLLYFLIGILLCIIWLLTLSKVKKSSINISLFLFIVSCIFWLICMYFWYYFVEIQKSNISIYFIRSAFTFWIFCTYFLCIYSYNFPRKNIIVNKHLITFSAILTIILAIIAPFTNLIYMEEIIENNILIWDVVWPLHPIFTLYTLMCIYFIIWILIKKYNKSMWIEKKKIQLILLWITSVVWSVTIFHIILPMFNIYLLQTEVIVFILIFIILAFYSMTKYRFLNISALFLRLSRATIIIWIFSIICISAFNAVKYLFPNIPESINVIISGLIWLNVIKIFEDIIPEFINKSMKEFRNLITEFKAGIWFCENYKSLISSLENIFILKLHIHNIKLILIRDKHSKINMPIFVKNDFSKQLKNNEILVNDEIDFLNISQNKKDIIKVNLKNLEASICLPLFFKNNLIWLFTLWPKSWDEIYSKEEIELVYWLKKKLEICFINILIKRHLQEENDLMKKIINDKTKNLRNQNKENMELLKQQSDFISVTAHEFRTPLSSAIFQVENILDTYNNTWEVFDDISSVWSSLENLKSLTGLK